MCIVFEQGDRFRVNVTNRLTDDAMDRSTSIVRFFSRIFLFHACVDEAFSSL